MLEVIEEVIEVREGLVSTGGCPTRILEVVMAKYDPPIVMTSYWADWSRA